MMKPNAEWFGHRITMKNESNVERMNEKLDSFVMLRCNECVSFAVAAVAAAGAAATVGTRRIDVFISKETFMHSSILLWFVHRFLAMICRFVCWLARFEWCCLRFLLCYLNYIHNKHKSTRIYLSMRHKETYVLKEEKNDIPLLPIIFQLCCTA